MILDLQALRLDDEPFEADLDLGEEELKIQTRIARLGESVKTHIKVDLMGVRVLVEGDLDTVLSLTCCRCAKSFPQEIDKEFRLDYWPDPEPVGDHEELELEYEDLDVGFYRDDELDISAVVSEQIVLEIPMKPLCSSDCKGLCASCGADLNQVSCDCKNDQVDPRWAVLKKLSEKM